MSCLRETSGDDCATAFENPRLHAGSKVSALATALSKKSASLHFKQRPET